MRVTIATLGSRGDVQPFLALAVALGRRGYTARLATNTQFRAFVEAHGVEFAPLGGDIKEIVGDEGRAALQSAHGRPLATVRALRRYVGPLVREALARLPAALEGSDVVIGQMLCVGAPHYAARHGLPYLDASYVPALPTRDFPHPGAPRTVPSGLASWATYIAAEQVFWQAFRAEVNAFRAGVLGLGPAPLLGPSGVALARRPPTLLGYSHALVPRARDWPDHVAVTGAWLLDPPTVVDVAPGLRDFLAARAEPPVYVGFGSMTSPDPEGMTRTLRAALRRAGMRAVLSTGWGGLARGDDDDDVRFVDDVPHGWLFPRVAGVVHHGGASTTAEGLRAGVPQLVVPFLADQPFWGRHVARAGVGPPPVSVHELTVERLAHALSTLRDPRVVQRARELGASARAEPGADAAAEALPRLIAHHRRR